MRSKYCAVAHVHLVLSFVATIAIFSRIFFGESIVGTNFAGPKDQG